MSKSEKLVNCKPINEMINGIFPSMLRPSHAFICVEVVLDVKIVGGQGTYMNVECYLTLQTSTFGIFANQLTY